MSGERIDDDPAAAVAVPAWVAEIEAAVGDPAYVAPWDAAQRDLLRLCREVRELSVVAADRRAEDGPAYVVIRRSAFDSDPSVIVGVFRSRVESVRLAQQLSEEPEDDYAESYRVEEWAWRQKARTVAEYLVRDDGDDEDEDDAPEVEEDDPDDDGEECPTCGGEGEVVRLSLPDGSVECATCHGSGRYTP